MSEGVLVMAYGTPRRLDEVAAYYTHIRRGSAPPPALLEELVGRYRAVGGPTRLNRITREQAGGLAAALGARGLDVPVTVGFKHVAPFVGDAVRELAKAGITRVVGLVLAPHFSTRSIAEYERYAREAAPAGLAVDVIPSWHDHPGLIAFLAGRLREALAAAGPDPHVLFTAHSVPARVLEVGDPYPGQLLETSERVAQAAGVRHWGFAYQSAGRTADPWLGPDVLDAIADLAGRAASCVVVQSIGFVADHLEILYDLDLEARAAAERRGMRFLRVEMPNAHPDFVAVLADVTARRLTAPAEGPPVS